MYTFPMNRKNLHRKITSRLAAASVFIAIAVLALLQYRWAVSSGEKIINDLAKAYNIRIFGTIAQEMSGVDLFNDRPPREDFATEENLRASMEQRREQFAASFPDKYLLSMSYFSMTDRDISYTYRDSGWVRSALPPPDILTALPGPDTPDFRDSVVLFNQSKKGSLYMVRLFRESGLITLVEFDFQNFLKDQLFPAIDRSFGGNTLKWLYELPENAVVIDERNYSFSPGRTILSYITGRNREYYISFSYGRSPLFHFGRDIPYPPEVTAVDDSVYLIILNESGDSLYFERELSLAVQWLTGLVLLLGVGGAYGLILYQKNRLSRLRQREKEFVATVTHELRTPLTVIHSAADNIGSGILTPARIAQYGDLIKEQSGRLSGMIEGILLFSRLEGKAELPARNQPLDFSRLKKDLEVFAESLSDGGRIKVHLDFGALPPGAVTDRNTVELVLTNLIANGSRHAYDRKESGEIRVLGHLKLPGTIVFSVEDDGFGIPAKERKHIFEPFFRGDRSMTEQVKGSGLGLYLVSRKIRLMGGTIKVESPYSRTDGKARKGCRFTVTFPYIELERAGA